MLRWSHTELGEALNPMTGVPTRRKDREEDHVLTEAGIGVTTSQGTPRIARNYQKVEKHQDSSLEPLEREPVEQQLSTFWTSRTTGRRLLL